MLREAGVFTLSGEGVHFDRNMIAYTVARYLIGQ